MITIQFLAGWAIRSSILILGGAVLLQTLRIRDASIRLAAWTAILCGSLMIPVMTAALPGMPLRVVRSASRSAAPPVTIADAAPTTQATRPVPAPQPEARRFDRTRAAIILYLIIAFAFLLRLSVGLLLGMRLFRASRVTDEAGIRESDRLVAPVTLGVISPAIVLPADWREWEPARLDAVLAHERSHIRRYDPALQVLSAVHRALLWFSPLSWVLHGRIVRTAEEASDDAALVATGDRAAYAETLLAFMRRGAGVRGIRGVPSPGVPMARYGRADDRIHRILESTVLSRGVSRRTIAAILAFGSPLAYVIATAQPQSVMAPASGGTTSVSQSAPPVSVVSPAKDVFMRRAPAAGLLTSAAAAQGPGRSSSPPKSTTTPTGLGNVTAATAAARPRMDGQLTSISFKEGEPVQEGQLLAIVDGNDYTKAIESMQAQLSRDQKQLEQGSGPRGAAEARVAADQERIDQMRNQMDAARITAPITGVAGLRLIEPGNMVRAGDPIVVIAQLQPICVVFTLPEDFVSMLRERLHTSQPLVVEAWNRDNSTRLATGVFAAMDNQIDDKEGTIKLKATFDNKDGALFPNEFVNVRVLMNSR